MRRWPGLLVLDFWIVQLRSSPLRIGGSNCASSLFSSAGCQSGKCCAPAEINGLTAGSAEFETTHVERCGSLPVAEVRHQGGQIGSRDDVKQFFLVRRQTRPDLPQVVDRIDVGNDGVMARALQPLVVESAARTPADHWRRRVRGLR